ncbi:MAG: hypothetical protein NTY01_06870 [Verrucomicrobia bacterium]|nr:hypothetical protein [Verrucomicrobiota bacterium]
MNSILHICAPASGHKGLGWNAWHTTNVLRAHGISADWVQVQERDIAAVVARECPRVAVVMALWVSTTTLASLAQRFPGTTFVVKNHSGPQFLSQEMRGWKLWLEAADLGASKSNVAIAAIRPDLVDAMRAMGARCVELPNVYSLDEIEDAHAAMRTGDGRPKTEGETEDRGPQTGVSPRSSVLRPPSSPAEFHIGLFGAFRPLKNVVGMATAAALATQTILNDAADPRAVVVHINGSRVEMGANQDKANVEQICRRAGAGLVAHGWMDHDAFKALAATMDVCLCASFHDTYNYVAADCVTAGAPVVGSPSVYWLPRAQQVNPDSTAALAAAILKAPLWSRLIQLDALEDFNATAVRRLLETLRGLGVATTEDRRPGTGDRRPGTGDRRPETEDRRQTYPSSVLRPPSSSPSSVIPDECSRERVPAAEPQQTENISTGQPAAATAV